MAFTIIKKGKKGGILKIGSSKGGIAFSSKKEAIALKKELSKLPKFKGSKVVTVSKAKKLRLKYLKGGNKT